MVTADLVFGIVIVVVGLVLFAIELAHPGALLFIPGSVLVVGGFLYLFLPSVLLDSPIGPIVVILAALLAGLLQIPYYRRVAPTHVPLSTTVRSFEGQTAFVTAAIVPNTLKGKVRVGTEIWSATSSAPIPAGAYVRVVRGEGVSLWVEPTETPAKG
ncbi:MAG TPA: NfeD family protein [Thermoplasmata archaeon]|nr:NfeD family protein [Thermoplasmata archaeon]